MSDIAQGEAVEEVGQVVMVFDKETKNQVRYKAEEEDYEAITDTIYVPKRGLAQHKVGGMWPQHIRVTVEVVR